MELNRYIINFTSNIYLLGNNQWFVWTIRAKP